MGEAEAERLRSRQPVNLTIVTQYAKKDWEPSLMVEFFLYMQISRIDRASSMSTIRSQRVWVRQSTAN